MTAERSYVIVGAGLAGAKAAETLRERGFDGRIALVGEDGGRPYERPPLSKALLLGTAGPETVYVHDTDWYAAHDVELRTGTRVERIDRQARAIELVGGGRLGYDKLLLTTGSVPRRLDVPGGDLPGVLYLRTLPDAERISRVLTDGAHIVVIGAGWIGLEVAAAARQHGARVTVVEVADLPLVRVLGTEVARVFADLHREHGVTFRFGAQVRGFGGVGRVDSVLLGDGTALSADAVVVGVGIRPRVELAEAAGLAVDDGILVDSALRTGDSRVYAAGDVARFHHRLLGRSIRVEHWANALHGGPAAARAMLGEDVTYDRLPYFFTDQYDLGMEYAGYAAPGGYDRVVLRGDLDKRQFLAFWLDHGRVVAGMNVNVWDVHDQIQALVRAGYAGRTVDPDRLADPGVPLGEVTG